MRIRRGNVVLGGSVYMPHGKVYIHDAGRLTFEIGKRRHADGTDHPRPRLYPDRIGEMIISRLTADQVIFTGDDPKVFIQFAHYLTRNDLQKFWGQLSFINLTQIDNVRKTRTNDGGDEGDGSALSQIFKVNDVFYNTNVNLLSRHNILLNVFSDGPRGTKQVGSITLKEVPGEGNPLLKGQLRLELPAEIGKMQYSSVVTGRTSVTPSTPSTPQHP